MIPLFRPIRPDLNQIFNSYLKPLETGQLTNFGAVSSECSRKLQDEYGGYWLPVTNGTAAIEAALAVLPKTVKRIAVPNFTFAATLQAVVRSGRTPVIIQCTDELNLDIRLLKKHRQAYDAVIGVIPFGYGEKAYERSLEWTCSYLGKPLIWDRAGAFPSISQSSTVVADTYSLHASKSLPIGEGGLIHFRRIEDYFKAKRFICFGFDDRKNATIDDAGNMKLDELRASVLLYFLKNPEVVKLRQEKVKRCLEFYRQNLWDRLKDRPDLFNKNLNSISLAVLNLPRAHGLCEHLNRRGISAKLYYRPLLQDHSAFKKFRFIGPERKSLKNWIALPSDASQSEQEIVLKEILDFYNQK